ncbi:nuclear pore complex assembly-domain-containing protein [Trametes meyenii]|nr:nuclear pore complex assembly-domain-containing protein [Trametes meyenii]
MDVDMNMSAEDDTMQYFEVSPAQFAWRAPRPKEIEVRRAHMSDVLIFDILLSSGGIRHPDTLFPPANPEALRKLLSAIIHSAYDALKQDCLIYFLLKWHQDGREDEFREKRCIPPQFAALSDAYWHLDSGINIARAVSTLSDRRINRDYPSKILQALSLADNASTLIRTYIRTANPLLTEPGDIDTYTTALAESSLMEAWMYQRTFSEISETRKRLVRKILDWCLTPKPRLAPLTHLLAFPFSPFEQSLIHAYALEPPQHVPAASVPVIQDLVCVRLVQSGQHAAAIKLDRQFASIPRGGDKGQKIAQERRQMMDELMAAMPAAERYLLELELENFAQGRGLTLSDSISVSVVQSKQKAKGVDPSMSWEHIAPSASNDVSKSAAAPPTLPISQRSNAPRFGGAPPGASAPIPPFISIGRSAPAIVPPSSSTQMPKPPSAPLLFGATTSLPASTSASAGGLFSKPGASTSAGAPTTAFGRGGSIFDIAGSANSAPNAFYQPPPSTNHKNSLFGSLNASTASRLPAPTSAFASLASQSSTQLKASTSGGVADTSIHGPHEADISMLSELSDADSGADASMSRVEPADRSRDGEDESSGFALSVFGTAHGEYTRPIATSTGSRLARTETEENLPPGAFLPEHDNAHDQEQESISATRTRGSRKTRASSSATGPTRTSAHVQRSPSPQQQQQQQPQSSFTPIPSTRTRKAVKDKDLNRSIPGSLMDDDDDDDDDDEEAEQQQRQEATREEEDVVAPLPPPTPARRTSRKSRASNGSTVEAPRVTRRSSRLSVVSSVGSSSPEPVSPQKISAKARRGGRASAAATSASTAGAKSAGVAKRSSRKKQA